MKCKFLKHRLYEEESGGDPEPSGGSPDGGGDDTGGGVPTVVSDGGSDISTSEPVKNYFETLPDDWRTQLAGENEGVAKHLSRYSDLGAAITGGYEAQQRIRRGEISNGLPDNPTEDQIKDWREANGVPQAVEDYNIQLSDGFVMGEEDESILNQIMPTFHETNISNEALNKVVNAFMVARQKEAEAISLQDEQEKTEGIRQLKSVWGGEFETNRNRITNVLERIPEDAREAVMSARAYNGSGPLIMNMPEFLQFIEAEERDRNPAGTVVPNANNPIQAIDDEIAKIEATISNDPDTYWGDQKMQDRYGELLQAKEKMGSRA